MLIISTVFIIPGDVLQLDTFWGERCSMSTRRKGNSLLAINFFAEAYEGTAHEAIIYEMRGSKTEDQPS